VPDSTLSRHEFVLARKKSLTGTHREASVAAGVQATKTAEELLSETGGRATPMTVVTPLRRGWATWLRLTWPPSRHNPLIARPLVKLSFIHAAHWTLFTHVPGVDGGDARRLRRPFMLFQTNFDGSWKQYLDAFALIVAWRIQGIWAGAADFPGPRPMEPFKQYAADHEVPAAHYFRGIPDATTTMAGQALALSERHAAFAREARSLDPLSFDTAWRRFLRESQHDL